MREDMGKYRD